MASTAHAVRTIICESCSRKAIFDVRVDDHATCMEIGSGAGRFTDYLVDLCKTVITIEPSQALTVNAALGALRI